MAGDTLDRAIALKRAGRLDEAVILLESILVNEPRNAAALAHLAHSQLRRGHPERALAELARASAASGTTAFVARVRGEALYRLSRHREAARAFEEAVALGDDGTWSLVRLARSLLRVGDLEGARQAGLRAAEREVDSGQGLMVLGEIALRERKSEEAEELLSRAHEREPANDYIRSRLVEAQLLRLPPEQRAREVEVLLKSGGGDNRYLHQVLARVRSQLGDERGAAREWRRSYGAHGDPFARANEGYALKRAGDLEGAARILRECLMEAPQDMILFRNYVRLQYQRGATDELERTLRELLPIAPEHRRGAVYGELRKLAPD